MEMIEGLLSRRSVAMKDMTEKGPGAKELKQILTAATRVPDHGKLAPWKIVVFDKKAQKQFGKVIAKRYAKQTPDAEEKHIAHEAERAARAPLMIAVISTPVREHKVPVWEQELSAGAVCTNILHAAHALGYGAKWLSEWIMFDKKILKALGGDEENDRIAGFIYIGEAKEPPEDRERPDLNKVVSYWEED